MTADYPGLREAIEGPGLYELVIYTARCSCLLCKYIDSLHELHKKGIEKCNNLYCECRGQYRLTRRSEALPPPPLMAFDLIEYAQASAPEDYCTCGSEHYLTCVCKPEEAQLSSHEILMAIQNESEEN